MKVEAKQTLKVYDREKEIEVEFETGEVYDAEKITFLGSTEYYIKNKSGDEINFNETGLDFDKCFSVVREMGPIESAVYQIQNMDDAIDELANVTVDTIFEDDNNGYEMAKGILNTFSDCETEKEFQIANNMLISMCGYSIETLLSKIKEKEQTEEYER